MLNNNVIIGLTFFLMSTITISVLPVNAFIEPNGEECTASASSCREVIPLIVHKATPLFGIDLPLGRESPTFIQNVSQLAKMGFDSPQNAKLFLQLDSIALNSSSHPGNVTLTTPTIIHIISVYNQMKSNNSTGGFTKIATVAMQALSPVSSFDGGGRNITKLPNSLDFSDILKSGILGAGIGCATGANSGDFAHIVGAIGKSVPCLPGALGAAVLKLIT
jgi:hypothetical protein